MDDRRARREGGERVDDVVRRVGADPLALVPVAQGERDMRRLGREVSEHLRILREAGRDVRLVLIGPVLSEVGPGVNENPSR